MSLPLIRPVRRKFLLLGLPLVVILAGVALYPLVSRPAVTGKTPGERVNSICDLASRRPRGSAEAIAAVVADPAAEVRAAAVTALAGFGRPADADLAREALKDPAPAVRAAAATALARYQQSADVAALRQLLLSDPEPRVRTEAARALGMMDCPAGVAELVAAMETHADPAVRLRAFRLLLEKQNVGYTGSADPSDGSAWAALCARVRKMPRIAAALAKAGEGDK
jgi:HEAT repeat protein